MAQRDRGYEGLSMELETWALTFLQQDEEWRQAASPEQQHQHQQLPARNSRSRSRNPRQCHSSSGSNRPWSPQQPRQSPPQPQQAAAFRADSGKGRHIVGKGKHKGKEAQYTDSSWMHEHWGFAPPMRPPQMALNGMILPGWFPIPYGVGYGKSKGKGMNEHEHYACNWCTH